MFTYQYNQNMSETPEESEEVDEPTESYEIRDLTISDAFSIGNNITFLRFAGEHGYQVGSVESGGILRALENIQNRLIATNTALMVASQIEDMKTTIHHAFEGMDTTTEINDEVGAHLTQKAQTWSEILGEKFANELRIKIPNSWILDLERLVSQPALLFESEVWDSMDDGPKRDIVEACRALPMSCSTACVMVSLRAVEHYLRKWYEHEYAEVLERGTWGSVLDDLMQHYISEEDSGASVLQQLSGVPSVLSNLYYLKEKRDKVSHPDETPSEYEAVITLFMVAGTISEVCRELGEVEPLEP